MKFGSVPIKDAVGAIVAHGVHFGGLTLRKGEIVTEAGVSALREAGIGTIVVARLDPDDMGEDEAARRIAQHVCGAHVTVDRAFTGRANLFSQVAGVLRVDTTAIDRLNGIDEAVTLATLPSFRVVQPGEMIATVKIIPFAVSGRFVDQALGRAFASAVEVVPFKPLRVAVISTLLPGLKPSVITKTLGHLAERLDPAAASIVMDERVPHEPVTIARMLPRVAAAADLVIIFGASAITDRRDVIPAALVEAGGTIEHFGMPVDPGNLLLLGHLRTTPVIGAPGCARSPKENGFDWVLQRLLAGLPVSAEDIRLWGVGGLLMEIVSRPQPRLDDGARGTSRPAGMRE